MTFRSEYLFFSIRQIQELDGGAHYGTVDD